MTSSGVGWLPSTTIFRRSATGRSVRPLSFRRSRRSPSPPPARPARPGGPPTAGASRTTRGDPSVRSGTPRWRRPSRSPYERWWCTVRCPSRRSSRRAAYSPSFECGVPPSAASPRRGDSVRGSPCGEPARLRTGLQGSIPSDPGIRGPLHPPRHRSPPSPYRIGTLRSGASPEAAHRPSRCTASAGTEPWRPASLCPPSCGDSAGSSRCVRPTSTHRRRGRPWLAIVGCAPRWGDASTSARRSPRRTPVAG